MIKIIIFYLSKLFSSSICKKNIHYFLFIKFYILKIEPHPCPLSHSPALAALLTVAWELSSMILIEMINDPDDFDRDDHDLFLNLL